MDIGIDRRLRHREAAVTPPHQNTTNTLHYHTKIPPTHYTITPPHQQTTTQNHTKISPTHHDTTPHHNTTSTPPHHTTTPLPSSSHRRASDNN
ncbi:hypothetical protein Pmani_036849 [Petrolisthes manimaculis]|uniref:Uncharacterized protein n=1 Tax=Petrolisthes manimaculis TaxID=1843537 RepID=A0AAE1TNZ3_9EUCA|nr:hypothetical protein Pmani_036849 [Petrolisthes manimaculis]